MRHSTTFRFDTKTLAILQALAQSLHCSKTTIVEQALKAYAQKNAKAASPLLKHAGVLSDEQASVMLEIIEHHHNKDTDIGL